MEESPNNGGGGGCNIRGCPPKTKPPQIHGSPPKISWGGDPRLPPPSPNFEGGGHTILGGGPPISDLFLYIGSLYLYARGGGTRPYGGGGTRLLPPSPPHAI